MAFVWLLHAVAFLGKSFCGVWFLWLLWFPERGIPHNGSFIIENPIKIMNDLGVPPLDMATLASPDRTGAHLLAQRGRIA